MQDASGAAWMQFSPGRALPALALTYNHRSEAMYRCIARHSGNPFINEAIRTGLRKVRMLRDKTPSFVVKCLCQCHNEFHQGSGFGILEFCVEVMFVEASWRASPVKASTSTTHPKHEQILGFPLREGLFAGFHLGLETIRRAASRWMPPFEQRHRIEVVGEGITDDLLIHGTAHREHGAAILGSKGVLR